MNRAYDDEAYRKALNRVLNYGEAPTYANGRAERQSELRAALDSRPAFAYDPAEDPAYRAYRRRYTEDGRRAMEDTAGRAASLTGGYGSTYAQTAGQNAYDSYLRQLGELLPELEENALGRWRAEGDALQNALEAENAAEREEYSRWQADYDRWLKGYLQAVDEADTAYDRAADADREAYDRQTAEAAAGEKNRQTAYTALVKLIQSTGYSPTGEELSAAGMSRREAEAWRDAYKGSGKKKSGSGGSGKKKKSAKNSGSSGGSAPLTGAVIGKYLQG